MSRKTDIWRVESNQNKQFALSAGCLAVGILIMFFSFRYDGPDPDNARAGSVLGLILTLIGLYSLIECKKQIVSVDPNSRQIIVETIGRFKTIRQIFLFDEINDISIGYIGKKSNFVHFYYLVLKMKDGRECSLFSPGYYDHGSNRKVVEGWRERLMEYLQS